MQRCWWESAQVCAGKQFGARNTAGLGMAKERSPSARAEKTVLSVYIWALVHLHLTAILPEEPWLPVALGWQVSCGGGQNQSVHSRLPQHILSLLSCDISRQIWGWRSSLSSLSAGWSCSAHRLLTAAFPLPRKISLQNPCSVKVDCEAN